ncbi:MAG: hypothetical protein ABI843_17470 [Dokdonella sp.]
MSLSDALQARPVDAPDGLRIVDIVRDHVGGRVPIIVAGRIRTPEQAQKVIDAGISLAAVGQGLVMNPDWVQFAQGDAQGRITLDIAASDVPRLAIPAKLGSVIEGTAGWFSIRQAA